MWAKTWKKTCPGHFLSLGIAHTGVTWLHLRVGTVTQLINSSWHILNEPCLLSENLASLLELSYKGL